jgi:hypothetical protein
VERQPTGAFVVHQYLPVPVALSVDDSTAHCCPAFLVQSREAKLRNPEDVAKYGSLLLQHYKHKLAEDEGKAASTPLGTLVCCCVAICPNKVDTL